MDITETEWVALISVSGTIISGGLGSLVTYRITERSINTSVREGNTQRDHDSSERVLDRQHEKDLADRNRDQERRQNAYVAIQTVVHAIDVFATSHLVGIGRPDDDDTSFPEIPPETEALAQLIASTAIVLGMDALNREMIFLSSTISDARFWRGEAEAQKPGALEDFHRANGEVRTIASQTRRVAKEVHSAMRDELLRVAHEGENGVT
jgi:hypothetical protein